MRIIMLMIHLFMTVRLAISLPSVSSEQPTLHDLLDTATNHYNYNLRDLVTSIGTEDPAEYAPVACFYLNHTILDFLIRASPYVLPLLLPLFGEAIEGDHLTGNTFVEGSNKETLVSVKLNKSLETLHHISFSELQQIFQHLREDITLRAHRLNHREDRGAILQVLRNRERRLLQNLSDLEQCIFHFRQNPQLQLYQQRLLLALAIAAPLILGTLLGSVVDISCLDWHAPSQDQLKANLEWFKEKVWIF